MNAPSLPTRLLLVEDDENDAILILASLRHGGLQISHRRVWGKAELQEALAQESWSAVLCDYNLPQFDGLAALKLVRAHDADIPFIIVSGAIGEETAVAAMRSGAQDFVMKQSLGRLGAVLVRELSEAEIRRAARLASSQLQAKEALLDSIVTTAADGIAVVNTAGLIEFANPALATLTAHTPAELLGLPVKQLLRPSAASGAGFWDMLCESTGAIRAATEEVTEETSPGYGIDGCSAPNFATTLQGLARAMGRFAGASDSGDTRQRAMHRLTRAMAAHPDLVAGEGRACTELMRAMGGRVAIKTGAEAVFVAILPDQQRGIAVKIADGNSRASEAVIAALLVRLGALDADHPATRKRLNAVQTNWRGTETGILRLADGFL